MSVVSLVAAIQPPGSLVASENQKATCFSCLRPCFKGVADFFAQPSTNRFSRRVEIVVATLPQVQEEKGYGSIGGAQERLCALPKTAQEKPLVPSKTVEEKLRDALASYTKAALKKLPDSNEREVMNRKLSGEVVSILLKEGIHGSLSGMRHPLFRKVYQQSLADDLKKNPNAVRTIKLAYGYAEEEIEWYS